VGGVSGETTRATRRRNPPRGGVATVEGTLIRRMLSAFAGRRGNATLGRSVSPAGGSFLGRKTHRRQRVSSGRMRRGTSPACVKRTHSSRRRRISASSHEGTSFARSRDPCTSIVTGTLAAKAKGGDAMASVSRSGKPTHVGGTGTGILAFGRLRGSPRLTASPICVCLAQAQVGRVMREA
jgi:hypothetical protein